MTHLTDEQLSALLDDALAPAARAECDAHLATCEACRAKLAELSSLERALGSALTHDPGEAYFASFAERVASRIAAGEARPATGSGAPATRRPPWAWLLSPRGLSFAGGMAALLLTAGIAWLRFQHVDVGSALRAAAPSAVGARKKEAVEPAPMMALEGKAVPAPAAAPPPSPSERSPEARADAGSVRALDAKQPSSGEPAPAGAGARVSEVRAPVGQATARTSAEQDALGARTPPAPTATGALKQQPMAKHRFTTAPPPAASSLQKLAPAPQATAEKDALGPAAAPGSVSNSQSARDEAQARGGRADEAKLQLAESTPLAVQCGTISDTRGTPLGGVQITLLGASTRSSRSAPDGSFCLTRAVAGDTLILMRVGFEPVRFVLTASTSLAFRLEPVGTLGSRGGLALGGKSEGLLKLQAVPALDVYAGVPDSVRIAVVRARLGTEIARRDHTADAWEAAASNWDGIAASVSGPAGLDARFQSLSALREAWRLTPTPARSERLRTRLAAFVAAAPATLPERATALRWQEELGTPGHH